MGILGWLGDLKYTIKEVKQDLEYKLTNVAEELGDSIKEKAQDLGDALSDKVEDSFERFERRGDQKVEDICNKIDKIEQADSIGEKMKYTFTSSRTLRNKDREEEFNKRERAHKGDIIGVLRSFCFKLYEHYGIYIGNDEVIHFTKSNGRNTIIKTSMQEFMELNKSNNMYFILDCEAKMCGINNLIYNKSISIFKKPIEIYSQDETVNRAKEHMGKQGYNLIVNNCEHFAIWCKTGLKYSYQVNAFLDPMFIPNNKKWIYYSRTNNRNKIVYWTQNGKSYHTREECSALSRSKKILCGTKDESGKLYACEKCN